MADAELTVGDAGEAAIIALFAGDDPAPHEIIVPNGDDAAAWRAPEGRAIVATTDALVEGVHFDLSIGEARSVGRKLIAVNLSDLAAMGAEPRYALISVCFPPETKLRVAAEIAQGVLEQAREHQVYIAGGNVSAARGAIVVSATLIGDVDPLRVLRRTGSVAGDAVFVTGTLGDARAGLILARQNRGASGESASALLRAQQDPSPRIEAGLALAASGVVHAACDVSDGLGRDLRRLLRPLGLGAAVDPDLLPISSALQELALSLGIDPIVAACAGGEDYELLFTAPAADQPRIEAACLAVRTPVRRIGVVLGDERFELRRRNGGVLLPDGFDHFQAS